MGILADGATGLAGFVGSLTDGSTGITSANLWNEVTQLAPLVIGVFIFAFGFGRIRKLLKSGSKGKTNI